MKLFNLQKPGIAKITVAAVLLLCSTVNIYAEGKDAPQDTNNQFKINSWTLENSADEQIRIDTAIELLKNPSFEARQFLLVVLGSSDNVAAAGSVCKAISTFRSSSEFIPNREDFVTPLMNMLKGQNVETARLAAQATLIFSYREVRDYFNEMLKDSETPSYAKRNVIYAIQIRTEKETVLQLINLLEDDDAVVSSVAGDALQIWMPIGTDKQQWQKIRKDIEKGRLDIVRERLLAQQDKVRRLNEDILKWQKRYLASLDNVYITITDDSIRAKFVAENLAFEQSSVKLWAIEKINMWQKSGKLLPLDVLQGPLILLVNDSDPVVRLAAAKLLGLLTNINSAESLLAQLKVEVYPDVKTELLISLGHVCNFALSPGAEIEINPGIRTETLKIAVEFFKNNQPAIAAEVIRSLLLQNGLEKFQVKPYFEFIAESYRKTQDEQERSLLLEEMQRLCGNDSYYRDIACDLFKPIFLDAVDSSNELIAAPAVSGILRVDQAGSFELLKNKGFTNHLNSKIRGELISVAGQIGTTKDIEWLAILAGSADTEEERQRAMDAMMNIFQYCKTDILISWGQKLYDQAKFKNDALLAAKARGLFEAAEKKADTEQDANTLTSLRHILADCYADASLYAQAAKYYGILLQAAVDVNEKENLTARLLDVNIRDGQTDAAKQLLTNILLSGDIGADNKMCQVLDKYFSENQDRDRIRKIFNAITSIKLPAPAAGKYPLWTVQVSKWRNMLKISDDKAVQASNTPAVSAQVRDSNSENIAVPVKQ